MSNAQWTQIQTNPFNWVLDMPTNLQIYGALLWELASRWDDHSGGRIVHFTPSDECLALGLSIAG